ncbi:HBL400Wp [Eremothecium sinecaudum]|uniref:Fructose-1,6-bisphosphatase n=1 Tax=Eremothecium sinecaudum TaxID=45286 RepID=A0A109UWM0_9SACH|nr:HBL400Wp [Eremothecium sinecaudum]AMD18502.1 HBL400Wp [Eremothecium sinecaudum]
MPPSAVPRKDLEESINTDIITLTRFILESQRTSAKHATGEFNLLFSSLSFAFKFIAQTIRRAELVNLIGLSGASNATGDQQKKLDVLGDEIFINAMKASGNVRVLVSEEQEDLIVFPETGGTYSVCCDPIDGSSNLDAGVSVGTIVSIFKLTPDSTGTIKDVLRCGKEMVAACYAMYGASTHVMLTTGQGVNGFTLDTNLGEFILTYKNLTMPQHNNIYSINEGNSVFWTESIRKFIESLKLSDKPYSARYIGSMVADVHRTLLYGGLFAYPCDTKNRNGKLRLLYEAFPMAFLVEQAGGKAVNDKGERILDLVPEHIHDKSSIWLGSVAEVDKYLTHIGK